MNAARDVVVDAIYRATRDGGLRPVTLDDGLLDARDRGLARAVHRMTLQRWLTINWVMDRLLDRPKVEPMLRAILAVAGAQLLFMDQPDHAVVDTAVEQTKHRLRSGASGMANAVLRRMVDMVVDRQPTGGWEPANNCIPWREGRIKLSRQALLKPRRMDRYLSVAMSAGEPLVMAWRKRWGDERTMALLLHALTEPPVFVHTPQGGHQLWQGDHKAMLAQLQQRDCWVQDPTAALAVEATRAFSPKVIVDYCAGRGTKTKQLAMTHPAARIVATDTDVQRFATLGESFAGHDRVAVVAPQNIADLCGTVDLLLLDVPCSNTGVLARRPEAKYRYTAKAMKSLIDLQRQIIRDVKLLLAPGGVVVYSTCSIEPDENEAQAAWLAKKWGKTVMREQATLPGGEGETYHDGGYYAVVG